MNLNAVLKAMANDNRMKIMTILLEHNYCVRALAGNLGISEAAASQHLKVLREAGLLVGVKKGHYMHYEINRELLIELACEIRALADTPSLFCKPEPGVCPAAEPASCAESKKEPCSEEVKSFCHGHGTHGADCHGHHE